VRELSKSNIMPPAGERMSKAFFAAIMHAMKGNDAKACEILRAIGEEMLRDAEAAILGGGRGKGRRKA